MDLQENFFRPVSEFMKSSQLATIYVGPQKEVFYLNLDLICDRLDFFKKALQGGFKEGQDKTIHLEEENPRAFALLVNYMYREVKDSNLICPSCDFLFHETNPGWEKDDHALKWLHLSIMADKFCSPELTRLATYRYQACINAMNVLPSIQEIETVYEGTSEDSDLRTLIADFYVNHFFQDPDYHSPNVDAWTEATNSNSTFNKDVQKAMFQHMNCDVGDCNIWDCKTHNNRS